MHQNRLTDVPNSPRTAVSITKRWRTVTVSIWLSRCSRYIVQWSNWCRTIWSWMHVCYNDKNYTIYNTIRLFFSIPSPPLNNIIVMVIVWRLSENIIRTALCWIVWHNVHSPQHTYVSSSYRSNRLGLSQWDPYTVCRGGCLELYYCNMVEWFW